MKQRIITGILAAVAFIILLILGGYWFLGLVLVLAVIGHEEYIRMIGLGHVWILRLSALVATMLLVVPWRQLGIDHMPDAGTLIWLFMLFLLTLTVATKNKVTIDQAALVLVGIVYLGFGFHYMVASRWLESGGLFWTLLIFLCIWGADAGAYFTGMFMGKRLLWPSISPKKTIEGAIGGTILSIVVAVVFSLIYPGNLELWLALILGAVIAITAQTGDLIQSAYKRVKGIKDTGSILPGHGGILDRVDSWLIVFPFLYLLSMIPY